MRRWVLMCVITIIVWVVLAIMSAISGFLLTGVVLFLWSLFQ